MNNINRKEFIKQCSYACLGSMVIPTFLQSCSSISLIQNNRVSGQIKGSDLIVPLSSFDHKEAKRLYIIVHHEQLKYPICVYRFSENDYSALWMACTHQGTELQVFGEKLECPAHGSEFNTKGEVENGPAEESLRTFPIKIEAKQIRISLKTLIT